jgi:poly(3-hydroxybutyrate) depolymerase
MRAPKLTAGVTLVRIRSPSSTSTYVISTLIRSLTDTCYLLQGLDDGVVPFNGRADKNGDIAYALPSQEVWRQQWAQRGGCSPPPTGSKVAPTVVVPNYGGINATAYRWNCPQSTIIAYTVQAMAHFWLTKAGGYFDETPANIMTFFSARPKGRQLVTLGTGDA